MAKNPFKKSSIIDTVVNVGVGGAANVAFDYVVNQIDSVKSMGETTVNLLKIAAGAIAGSMVSNKIARAAADGVATVGVSNLISGLMADDTIPSATPTGALPRGTIGRVIPGNRAYRRAAARGKVSGVNVGAVMGQ